MSKNEWINTVDQPPPPNTIVETKIDDAQGCRNVAQLQRVGRLWYVKDGSMYVYYAPTHWRLIPTPT